MGSTSRPESASLPKARIFSVSSLTINCPQIFEKSPKCPTNPSGTHVPEPTAREPAPGTFAFRSLKYELGGSGNGKWRNHGRGAIVEERQLTMPQPCLHTQGRSHQKIRSQHLPSMLP